MTPVEIILAALAVLGAYLVGAIPVGFVVGKLFFNTDLFKVGSKSMGATNAFRSIGWHAGAIVLLGDLLKGAVPALIIGLAMPAHPEVQAIGGVAAVVGHSKSIFAGLRGGRGVATGIGAAIVIFPVAAMFGVPIGVVIVIVLRYVSLGSMAGSLITLVAGLIWYFSGLWSSQWGLVFVAPAVFLIIIQHRANIWRLTHGTELSLAEWPTYFAARSVGRGERRRRG